VIAVNSACLANSARQLLFISLERFSIWIAFGIALLLGGALFVFARFPARPAARALPPANSLMVINPYKYEGTWVFDDPATGLKREPFVLGIDTMIDKMVAEIPNAEQGFRALFSAKPFPGSNLKLEWRRAESGGNWYYSDQFKMEGWLCPALFKYFVTAPREIYVKAEAIR
jgi:hypothetical protein